MAGDFSLPIRVYYEDTDAGGVVYYANYLKFMERARSEWLRSLGFEQDELRNIQGILFAVHSATLAFHKPARFNDMLTTTLAIHKCGGASMEFKQAVLREDDIICSAEIKIACVDAETFLPRPIPDEIDTEIKKWSRD